MENITGRTVLDSAFYNDCSFLTPAAVAIVARDPETRLTWLLVRCQGSRFSAPAQDVQHLIDIIGRDATDPRPIGTGTFSDSIRDVSIPAGYKPTAPKYKTPRRGNSYELDMELGVSDADPGL